MYRARFYQVQTLHKYLLLLLLAFSLLTLNGCSMIKSWLPDEVDETKNWSASKLYAEAKADLNSREYKSAIDLYEKLGARYPYGTYAQQAQLETAYAYYKYEEPESAIATLDRFIKLYPRHTHVDYAYYLRGVVNFPARKSVFEFIFPQDESRRDPSSSMESFNNFTELVTRFPDSQYTPDALLRMRYLRNKVAKHEIHVANYYMKRKAYIAAADRATYVIEHFQKTPAVREALLILVTAYTEMDLPELAEDAQRVYNLNKDDLPEDVFFKEESVIPGMPDWMRI
jgi:outer membrane protein assembly factor BamD